MTGLKHTTFLPTVSSTNKMRTLEADLENEDEFAENQRRPIYKLYTYSDEEILADPRLVVENVLRERGLLHKSKYAVDQIMKEFRPLRKPRPDVQSQLDFITEEQED